MSWNLPQNRHADVSQLTEINESKGVKTHIVDKLENLMILLSSATCDKTLGHIYTSWFYRWFLFINSISQYTRKAHKIIIIS